MTAIAEIRVLRRGTGPPLRTPRQTGPPRLVRYDPAERRRDRKRRRTPVVPGGSAAARFTDMLL